MVAGATPPTILLVDDEPSIRQLMRFMLERDGYVVWDVSNGAEALAALNSMEHPDLILLDLMMPVMNGWIFFETIKADHRFNTIPVVIITAYSRSEIHIPDVECLRKPLDFDAVRKTLTKYCRDKTS